MERRAKKLIIWWKLPKRPMRLIGFSKMRVKRKRETDGFFPLCVFIDIILDEWSVRLRALCLNVIK